MLFTSPSARLYGYAEPRVLPPDYLHLFFGISIADASHVSISQSMRCPSSQLGTAFNSTTASVNGARGKAALQHEIYE